MLTSFQGSRPQSFESLFSYSRVSACSSLFPVLAIFKTQLNLRFSHAQYKLQNFRLRFMKAQACSIFLPYTSVVMLIPVWKVRSIFSGKFRKRFAVAERPFEISISGPAWKKKVEVTCIFSIEKIGILKFQNKVCSCSQFVFQTENVVINQF